MAIATVFYSICAVSITFIITVVIVNDAIRASMARRTAKCTPRATVIPLPADPSLFATYETARRAAQEVAPAEAGDQDYPDWAVGDEVVFASPVKIAGCVLGHGVIALDNGEVVARRNLKRVAKAARR